ncbi:hypothetical protein RIF29_14752 [Crotalaria pallida]|uniref:Uncharacterized protein n=1 Tax=Crotalaria pallida TaxID=3830 RepID=A0AAN9FKQ5_CROPI
MAPPFTSPPRTAATTTLSISSCNSRQPRLLCTPSSFDRGGLRRSGEAHGGDGGDGDEKGRLSQWKGVAIERD